MPRSKKKKKSKRATQEPSGSELERLPPGMPAEDSIQQVMEVVSPQNVRYKILRTNEMDAYDPVPEPQERKPKKKPRARR